MKALRIATRKSPLALAQAQRVARLLERALARRCELVPLVTSGDRRDRRAPAGAVSGKGLFTREIEEALLQGRAELAVHSAKDLPGETAPGLVLAAFPERADPRDALVAQGGVRCLVDLPQGAKIGTGSLRRRSQLSALRPDFVLAPLEGNVDTRLGRLEKGDFDALLLAAAGLDRLERSDCIDERVAPELVLPAAGQGALCIETRAASPLCAALEAVDDPGVRTLVEAERSFLRALSGDCNVPLAAFAERLADGRLRLRALVAEPDGTGRLDADETSEFSLGAARELGERTAQRVAQAGGAELLARLRAAAQA